MMLLDSYKPALARTFVAASSQYLEHAAAALTAAPITMACWFISDSIAITQTLVSFGVSGSGDNRIGLFAAGATGGDPIAIISRTTTNATAVSATGYSANQWTHACGIEASTTSRTAFINGVAGTTETTSKTPAGINRTCVGRLPGATNYMSGQVVWPAIWNVALTAAEVALLASGCHPRKVRPESLVAFWEWTGADIEQGYNAGYPLTNTGTVPINGPAFLRTRIPRPALVGGFTQPAVGGTAVPVFYNHMVTQGMA